MMAKITKGSDFKGVVDYIIDKDKGVQIVAYDGLFMENKDTIAMSFNVQWQIKHKGQTDEIQGVVFTKNGYRFNGSKVDRCFSYSKIDMALQRNRHKECVELASTAKHHVSEIPNVPSQPTTEHCEFFNGSLGLLNGISSYNAADAEVQRIDRLIVALQNQCPYFLMKLFR